MKMLENSTVNLHPIEKAIILVSTIFIAFILFTLFYVMAREFGGIYAFTGFVGCLISPGIPFIMYRTLHGKGLNK